MKNTLQGIHHITAIAGDPARNLRFYRDVLGLRFVKRTVNFDDPFTYHFYFGDTTGSPGTILTFFPWPQASRGRTGAGVIETVSFAVPPGSLGAWRERLVKAGVAVAARAPAFGEQGIAFADPDGMQLELVESVELRGTEPWTRDIGADLAIRSFHGAMERVREHAATDRFVREELGFVLVAEENERRRYRTGDAGIGYFDVIADPAAPPAASGRGSVHHIAWATPDLAASESWRGQLLASGHHVSPVMDRNYFRSIYFREPSGVLFEMATLDPGFTVDEPAAALGEGLKLPAMYEAHRESIAAALPRLP